MNKYSYHYDRFGGIIKGTSAHLARTVMFSELEMLLQSTNSNSNTEQYKNAIIEDNCLRKYTVSARKEAYRKLKMLYALNTRNKLFSLFRKLYESEPEELPLLAYMCAYCRDYLLRSGNDFLQTIPTGMKVCSDIFVPYINKLYPNIYSQVTINSISRNLLSSFYKTGHISGTKINKIRSIAKPGAAAVTFAAILAYVSGERGFYLCDNEFTHALDCSKASALSLLSDADAKGLIRLRLLGEFMDIKFTCAEEFINE